MDEETMASEEAFTAANTQSTPNNTETNPPKIETPVSSTGFQFVFGSDKKPFASRFVCLFHQIVNKLICFNQSIIHFISFQFNSK
jgi:hypothetical protein